MHLSYWPKIRADTNWFCCKMALQSQWTAKPLRFCYFDNGADVFAKPFVVNGGTIMYHPEPAYACA